MAKSTRLATRCRDPADQRQDFPFDVLGSQRADLPIADVAAAVHDIGLGHPVDPEIDCGGTFAVDADGLLTVSAMEKTTGVRAEIAVKPSYGLTEAEMADMLRDSLVHAREDMQQRLLIEARVEAERVLLALNAAIAADGALLSNEERAVIDSAIAKLRRAIKGEDRDVINAAVDGLDQATHAFAQRRMDRAVAQALKGHSLDEVEASMATDPAPDGSRPGRPGAAQ